jgi:hypothetical protein
MAMAATEAAGLEAGASLREGLTRYPRRWLAAVVMIGAQEEVAEL